MSFAKRALELQFVMADGTLDGQNNTVTLTGHRCEAIISNPGGDQMNGSLQMRVFGMKLQDMNQFSTAGQFAQSFKNSVVKVSAGDVGGAIRQVFEGGIIASYIDFNAAPDVSFNVTAKAAFFAQVFPTSPNSYKGSSDVATMIAALAKTIGYGFSNNGVSIQLSNQYLSGSAFDQINTIAHAARIPVCIENGVVSIWPNNGVRDGVEIDVGPTSGLVGYPEFTIAGFKIRTEFNPLIQTGRTVNLTSSIPKANGPWTVHTASHELSTLTPNGPWFTSADLLQQGLYVSNN